MRHCKGALIATPKTIANSSAQRKPAVTFRLPGRRLPDEDERALFVADDDDGFAGSGEIAGDHLGADAGVVVNHCQEDPRHWRFEPSMKATCTLPASGFSSPPEPPPGRSS